MISVKILFDLKNYIFLNFFENDDVCILTFIQVVRKIYYILLESLHHMTFLSLNFNFS